MIRKLFVIGFVVILALSTIPVAACKPAVKSITIQPFPSAKTAAQLVFSIEPGGAAAGAAFATQPVIAIEDGNGNTVGNAAVSVTVIITAGTGTSGAVLAGTRTVNAVNGLAVFTDLSIDRAGQDYALTAMSPGLTSAISHSFSVDPGIAAKLIFVTEPSGAAAGTYFQTQPVIAVEDVNGNVVADSNAAVTLAITPGTGTAGAVLSGGTTVNAVKGIATFAYLVINLIGSEYTLTATSPGLNSITSDALYVTAPTTTP